MHTPEFIKLITSAASIPDESNCLRKIISFTLTTIAFAATSASAAVITPTAVVDAPDQATSSNVAEHMINGNGLSAVGDVPAWTHSKAGGGNYYSTQGGVVNPDNTTGLATGLTLTFTLPTDSTVSAVHHWVSGGHGGNAAIASWGVRTFDISFSTDGGSTFGTTITGATLGDFTAYDHTIPEYLVTTQTKQFTQQTGVDAIQLSNIYVFDGALADRVAIMEMRFDSVPEPSAALLGGLGALLLLRRRRHA